ncbi:MAG: proline dehydrogenase family protein [Elusimicrobia bacterium]|nr:proline dehydrogenase family protein [Elusimicrobiota bacterium]
MLFLANRFVAGETKREALARVREIQKLGLSTTLDFLGEHTKEPDAAAGVAREYSELLEEIGNDGERACTISVKLTHLGLDISDELALKNMRMLLALAKQHGNFVRIDMEGSPYTERTLDIFETLRKEYGDHVGIVIQAYLYRSADDIGDLVVSKARVRLCKGAYKESPAIAFAAKNDVDANYDHCCEMLLKDGQSPAVATHDELRIRNAIAFARKYGKTPKDFEFQMLLGIRTKLAMELVKSGYRVRLYLPYGNEWFRYFYRRIRERKENFLFVAKNFFKN